ncbi:hypothetical protein BC835DRAFT_1313058 [Cytidiella melzeri]|nr:hypothetical protein BC835DRAFT_1313058 [Cytidiella melzeri]
MESFVNVDNFWDLPQHPSTFSTLPEDDFLALLQKQFPTSNTLFDLSPPDGVDPLNINPLGIPNPTPPSTDSSPSPASMVQEPPSASRSRPESGVFSGDAANNSDSSDDPTLKRKASNDSMDDEPTYKNVHTASDPANKRPASGPHRRKSTGHHQDETRLMKRKEQNRAAQRAFRERKEKHVKDLEDKVAALEAKNQVASSENENLRDLLSRLQSENMALKQAAFTFSVPKPNNAPPIYQPSPPQHIFSSPGASTSTASSPVVQILQQQQYESTFASLIPFDPASLSMIDEPTATDSAMNMDYGFGQPNGMSPYKTIASNPMYMSFAEPTPYDLSPPPMHPILQAPSPADSSTSGMQSFSSWTSPGRTALESLFGGYQSAQPTVDFSALLESPPSALSPVSHAGAVRSNPSSPSSATSPAPQTLHQILPGGTEKCPRTREEVSQMIQQQGQSAFVQDSPVAAAPYQPTSEPVVDSCTRLTTDTFMNGLAKTFASPSSEETTVGPDGGFVKKISDGTGSIVMCKGSSFPKTEKSDRNIEVLTAWRSITSNPHFKNVDINDLCSEFTKKARCDGTKVVLEPQGVNDIMETLGKQR